MDAAPDASHSDAGFVNPSGDVASFRPKGQPMAEASTPGRTILRLKPGDPAPWFFAPTAENPCFDFASVAGHYVLLVFAGEAASPVAQAAHGLLRRAQAEGLLDDVRAVAFAVSIDPADDLPGGPRDIMPGLRILKDRDRAISRQYRLAPRQPEQPGPYVTAAFLLDPLLRVIDSRPLTQLGELLDVLRGLPDTDTHVGFEVPAPVLVLPRVMEPHLCRRFIAAYEAGAAEESGFMIERDGKTIAVHDRVFKRRQDHRIVDASLRAALESCIDRRIAPEMRKAFQFNPTWIERYIVARYDGAEGGHFLAHRDNTTPGTAHRRFAVTINLNDDFDGGALWFPEFGSRRYRPPAGAAMIFSCSLLHEATPVTRGTRYATLPFLYDDNGQKLRQKNMPTFNADDAKGG
jgi:predicted 2-oxoglutarate/Fe(II)-dependent dioxygenase YbiX